MKLEDRVNEVLNKGGKKGQIGETRVWGGISYTKHADGWKAVGGKGIDKKEEKKQQKSSPKIKDLKVGDKLYYHTKYDVEGGKDETTKFGKIENISLSSTATVSEVTTGSVTVEVPVVTPGGEIKTIPHKFSQSWLDRFDERGEPLLERVESKKEEKMSNSEWVNQSIRKSPTGSKLYPVVTNEGNQSWVSCFPHQVKHIKENKEKYLKTQPSQGKKEEKDYFKEYFQFSQRDLGLGDADYKRFNELLERQDKLIDRTSARSVQDWLDAGSGIRTINDFIESQHDLTAKTLEGPSNIYNIAFEISSILRSREEIKKSLGDSSMKLEDQVSEILSKGGKRAQVGETRTWSGIDYIKHADGWVIAGGKSSGKVLGKDGKIVHDHPNKDHHARAVDDHVSKKEDISKLPSDPFEGQPSPTKEAERAGKEFLAQKKKKEGQFLPEQKEEGKKNWS